MLSCINSYLAECQQKNLLNQYECYVLAAAVYLHDIGIQNTKTDMLEKFATTHNVSFNGDRPELKAEFIRNNHAQISSFIIKEDLKGTSAPIAFDGPQELGQLIALVVESHGIDFFNNSEYKNYVYHNEIIRIKLLSVILCLADCFDCDNRRIDRNRFKYSELAPISRIHWMKHSYVSGINIKNHLITISYNFPNLSQSEKDTYRLFFCEETEYWIKYIKTKYMMILNEYNLLFELKQNVSYEEFSTPLNDEDYSVIEEKLFDRLNGTGDLQFKKVSIGVLIFGESILMVRRRKKEKNVHDSNSKEVLEWQFPAGLIKTTESPEEAIIREFKEETNINCAVKRLIGKRLHPNTATLCYYYTTAKR